MSARLTGTPPFPPLAATDNPARPTNTTSCDLRLSTITQLLIGAGAQNLHYDLGHRTSRSRGPRRPCPLSDANGAEFIQTATRVMPQPPGVSVDAAWVTRIRVPFHATLLCTMGSSSSPSLSAPSAKLAASATSMGNLPDTLDIVLIYTAAAPPAGAPTIGRDAPRQDEGTRTARRALTCSRTALPHASPGRSYTRLRGPSFWRLWLPRRWPFAVALCFTLPGAHVAVAADVALASRLAAAGIVEEGAHCSLGPVSSTSVAPPRGTSPLRHRAFLADGVRFLYGPSCSSSSAV